MCALIFFSLSVSYRCSVLKQRVAAESEQKVGKVRFEVDEKKNGFVMDLDGKIMLDFNQNLLHMDKWFGLVLSDMISPHSFGNGFGENASRAVEHFAAFNGIPSPTFFYFSSALSVINYIIAVCSARRTYEHAFGVPNMPAFIKFSCY